MRKELPSGFGVSLLERSSTEVKELLDGLQRDSIGLESSKLEIYATP